MSEHPADEPVHGSIGEAAHGSDEHRPDEAEAPPDAPDRDAEDDEA